MWFVDHLQTKNIEKLALAVSLFDSNNMESLDDSLSNFSEFLRNYLKETFKPNSFNCPQSVDSSLAWRMFLFKSLSYLVDNDLKKMDVNWSKWTKSASALIKSLPRQNFCSEDIAIALAPLADLRLVSPSGSANLNVDLSIYGSAKQPLAFQKSTIHGAKGETHDITIVISTARAGNDSHWLSWIDNPDSEAARFAYVASSRPKEYLIWAVKTLKVEERLILEGLGFTVL